MRRLTRGVDLQRATAHLDGLHFFSTWKVALAPKRAVRGRGRTHTAAVHGKTSSLEPPPPPAALGSARSRNSAALSGGDSRFGTNRSGGKSPKEAAAANKNSEDVDVEEEERLLAEDDTRFAMRLLMQHHFLYQHNVRRPEERRLEEEREMLREKHRARMERIEEKTRNAMQLGPDVSVDGILPLYGRGNSAAAALASKPSASWMRLNPVEAETGDNDGDDGESRSITGALLTKPDMSVYSVEHDHRIRSSEVLDEEQRRRREELKSGDATKKLWSQEELEMGGGLTPQRVMESQMLEDEDQDFAVEAYSSDYDE
ncbi:hypothetical protein TcG_06727 [Trypanosoma cruzi]|uniref:Uncharacterized protein n=2 Tax=Trypanosoma cruzi TaxID=5693 RepID=V5ARZ4_TRYCR|nr:hypothetical protein TCDM_08634 [Trypanosoma cruzi Dm28c]PBJ77163.1 hypothetical protein BCY84_07013 [Trypanosoma cruzi cruzi]PWU90556.1 hypothetical protein C4B63_49g169 [Trypanosoma cruzi]RNF15933.1 hypothetical protein TcG_06727 [Trypanosoma cruzi]